jgi:acetylornithine deacetylase/succinyl-diaminopimelate desuccinylase-like protein
MAGMTTGPALALLLAPALAAAEPAGTQLPPAWQAVAREILAELVRIDTTHEKGITPASQAIARRLRAAGFPEADLVLAGPEPERQNLVARLRGTGRRPPVLFIAHLDVVAALRSDWSVEPFALTEADGWLYGRGTSDMKGDAAALVAALLRLRQEGCRPDRDLAVAFTDDEEGNHEESNGARWLLARRPDLVRAAFVVNPDAGGGETSKGRRLFLEFETAEKVYASFRLEATDRGGHSSVPHAGNPIYRLAAALSRLEGHVFPLRLGETVRGYFGAMATLESGGLADDLRALSREPTDPAAAARVAAASDSLASLMRTTCVATELSGGHAENALPQLARASVNCRVLPEEQPAEVEATLRRLAGEGVSVAPLNTPVPSPPSSLDPAVVEPVTRIMHQLFPGVRLVPVLSAGASDSIWFRNAGIPTYGLSGTFGDIDDPRAHGRDERLALADFHDGAEFAYRLMRELGGVEAGGCASPVR